jgi:hypothetical protein
MNKQVVYNTRIKIPGAPQNRPGLDLQAANHIHHFAVVETVTTS